jgi:glycosyltransferase involved in cell wall biosynthesis
VHDALHVLSYVHSLHTGGAERVVLRLIKAWREHSIDARIAMSRKDGVLTREAADLPVFAMQPENSAIAHLQALTMIRKLPAIIRKCRPHVLFFGSNDLAVVALAMRLRLGRDCPPMVLKISQDLRRPDMSDFALRIDRWLLRLHAWVYARVIALALPDKAQIVEEMGLPDERVVVINNASMTAKNLERLATARDRAIGDSGRAARAGRHFLGIGPLMPQKNFELLAEAFARIARPEDRLTIIGEGPLREAIEALTRTLGVADQVHLPGYRRDVENWLADADAFVLSSDFEEIGNVVVEALAAGVPVVATHCCAAMPMLVEGAGILVPILNAAALADAMDEIGAHDVDVSSMRTRAAHFIAEATIDRWRALFDDVAR